ncbi:MAG TPA: T9SS type A sorting domain-containing protein, partial [Bacteroidia bacterium]
AIKRPIDRPWLVADNSATANSGTLYITTKPAPWIAPPNRNYFKVSSDSGRTWSPIANIDGGTHLVGSSIAAPMAAPTVTLNGKFCAVYPSYVSSQNPLPAFYLASSKNKGQTFSYTTVFAAIPAANDTNLKNGYQLIADPIDSNKLIFFTPDAKNGDDDIMAFHSNDGGQTWSNEIRVNDDVVANGKAQDMVWGAYNELGNLVVTWRDRRNSSTNGFWNAGYDFYYAVSNDNGQTFSANQKLSSQFISFDTLTSKNGNDFMSCSYCGDTLYSVWGDTRTGKMNIFFAKTIASSNTNVETILLDGEETQLQFFPNPFSTQTIIHSTMNLENATLTIYNSSGQRIKQLKNISGTTCTLNRDDLPSGNYFLILTKNNRTMATGKLMVTNK